MKSLSVGLAIMFSVLMSNIANAECAWVLWEKEMRRGHLVSWKILVAHPKYDQCKAAQKDWFEFNKTSFERMKKNRVDRIKDVGGSPFYLVVIDYEDNMQRVFESQCLPDTIDPRK